mgnify:CR=1 FL=1
MYFTDRGIEELEKRRGDEEVTLAWLADRLQEFTDIHPEFEVAVERLATWLARVDDPDDECQGEIGPDEPSERSEAWFVGTG